MFDQLDWYLRRAAWRSDPATDAQRNLIRELGLKSKPETKGEASDLIARNVPPSDDELSFLHENGVDGRRMSQYEAMDAVARIITDEPTRTEWIERQPLKKKGIRAGDRVILLNDDNTTWIGEITSASSNPLRIRPVMPDGKLGDKIDVHTYQLLGRENGRRVKHIGNLISGDLIYSQDYKSGLQYAVVVRGSKYPSMTCRRWMEAKSAWTKNATRLNDWSHLEWLGHESYSEALEAFFARIEIDRKRWLACSGRSGFVRDPNEPGTYRWQQKARVWRGHGSEPVQFASANWSNFERAREPKRSLISRLTALIFRKQR